jgi:hypothetical protein
VTTRVEGGNFGFEFKFRSSTKKFLSHQMVMDGTATCESLATGFRVRKSIRTGPPPVHVSQPAPIKRKQYSKREHPWMESGGAGGGSFNASTGALSSSESAPGLMNQNQYDADDGRYSPISSGIHSQSSQRSTFSRQSSLRTSATNLVASLSQPSWKQNLAVERQRRSEQQLVKDLDNFIEPKTRNIRFY